MSVILSCGCRAKSQSEGILCEWDAESRECEAAVAFGCVCAIHYRELNARPADELEAHNAELKAYNTTLHGIEHDLEMKVSKLQAENDELKATMRSFFEDFLNVREESDSGRVFAPVTLSSTRCMMTEPLGTLLNKMRKLSGAKPPPKRGD